MTNILEAIQGFKNITYSEHWIESSRNYSGVLNCLLSITAV